MHAWIVLRQRWQRWQHFPHFCYHTRINLRSRRVTKIPCLGNKIPLSCLQKRCLTPPKRCQKTAQKPSENLRNAPQTNKIVMAFLHQRSVFSMPRWLLLVPLDQYSHQRVRCLLPTLRKVLICKKEGATHYELHHSLMIANSIIITSKDCRN